jgi:antitoxin component of MazEF toxin-antitoxin module
MQVAIREMGNSQGILIPKPILAQAGLADATFEKTLRTLQAMFEPT